MRFPRLERDMIGQWVDGMESNPRLHKRGDLRNRQGSLLGGLLNGGNSLLGNLLGKNRSTTTTTTEQPPATTTAAPAVSNPPATTAAPPPTQAETTTQAPVATVAPTTTPPEPATTAPAPAPTFQQPVPTFQQPAPIVSSSTTQRTSTSPIPIAIPVVTTALLIPSTLPGDDGVVSSSTALLPTFALPLPPNLAPSSITDAGPVYPTTFATSVRSPSTSTLLDDSTTANPIMGGGMSGMGGISKMTIIISVIAILVGVLAIFLGCWFLSQKYIRKRKITIALDMRISQLQAGDGPLPPVPMREKVKNEAMVFMMRFPRPPSLKRIRSGGKQGGFEVIR